MKRIMFNDRYGLTEAVLNGSKTQTRRIIYPQPTFSEQSGINCKGYAYGINGFPPTKDGIYYNFLSTLSFDKSFRGYKVGEVVAVAQSYKEIFTHDNCVNPRDFEDDMPTVSAYNNKMFVRADLMPHQIEITNIRLDRLQDISDNDCLAEGIAHQYVGYGYSTDSILYDTPREAYAALIDKISGKGTWKSNPYVFVYEFKLIK